MAPRKRVWVLVVGGLVVSLIASMAVCTIYMCVPYEDGPWHQTWAATVTHEGRSGTHTGFGLGRCGDEGAQGATVAKERAMQSACFAAGACPGDSVCDCSSRAQVLYRCEAGQNPGPTRAGDMITVPVH